MRQRDPLASYNERIKLRSSFLNALSLGVIGFALLRPLVEGNLSLSWITLGFLIAGLVLHMMADYILKYLVKED